MLQRCAQAGGLGSFLGGRIQLFPHQLHAAERACKRSRALAAGRRGRPRQDRRGLPDPQPPPPHRPRRAHAGRGARDADRAVARRAVAQVPPGLRAARRRAARRRGRATTAPASTRSTCTAASSSSLGDLVATGASTEQAVEAGIDLLVVDEAHHLRRPPGHPGNAAYRAVAPIAALGRHVLLLTATPLEDDAHGFFRLLQLLRPEEFPRTKRSRSAWPGASRCRPAPAPPGGPTSAACRRAWPAGRSGHRLGAAARLERMRRCRPRRGSSARRPHRPRPRLVGPALAGGRPRRRDVRRWLEAERATRASAGSPSRRPLAQGGEKTLVFVAHRETLETLKTPLESGPARASAIFHEDLSPERRDIEVAAVPPPEGPALLISTEAGGEGRNFEFCRRLVLFDLPWNPAVVEQRIGRLDRIGRTLPTEIVYFRPPAGFGRAWPASTRRSACSGSRWAGWSGAAPHRRGRPRGRGGVARSGRPLPCGRARRGSARGRGARASARSTTSCTGTPTRKRSGDPRRVPPDLDALNESFVPAPRPPRLRRRRSRAGAAAIELGGQAIVDRLPGRPGGSRYLGTFDRAEAVVREELEYFASGHPLVEGLLAELEDGRAAGPRCSSSRAREDGAGPLSPGRRRRRSAEREEATGPRGTTRPDWRRGQIVVEPRSPARDLARGVASDPCPARFRKEGEGLRSGPRGSRGRRSGPRPWCVLRSPHPESSTPFGEVQPVHHHPAVADHEQRVLERPRVFRGGCPRPPAGPPRNRPRPRRSSSRVAAARRR